MRNGEPRCGTVLQVTDKFIVIQGDKYKDTISVADLICGQVQILDGEGEIKMCAKENKPSKDELERIYLDNGKKIDPVAKHYKVGWLTAKEWLQETGLLDNNGTTQEPKNKFEEVLIQLEVIQSKLDELQTKVASLNNQSTPTTPSNDWDRFLQLLDRLMPYVVGRKEVAQ